jgi:putative DNA methylase
LTINYKPKLIEVALPLAAINAEAAREKSIRHGHPSTLHLWWARRPLAAARAVIWASMVDDPSGDESLTEDEQERERQRLFGILERLVKWENSNNTDVLAEARAEIDRCFPDGPPLILDPFGGGGAIPLEAQRLGLKALSGDLNPVAVLIQKAMIEIPPRFAARQPVHPDIDRDMTTWERAQGLAADVAAYGTWMREEAKRRVGHLYPDAIGPSGEKLTPIAWIWARTVESPDPTWRGHVPLVASWELSKRKGKPTVWIEPIVNPESQTISYEVREGGAPSLDRTVSRGSGTCIATKAGIPSSYIKDQGSSDLMSADLMAVVADGDGRRIFLKATEEQLAASAVDRPHDLPPGKMSSHPQYMGTPRYGLDEWHKLFTSRQLVALNTFSELLSDVHRQVAEDAERAGFKPGSERLRDGADGATAYADAVVTYLAFTIDKCANLWSNLVTWMNDRGAFREVFARQAIPMTWDFAEANPFSGRGGSWDLCLDKVQMAVGALPCPPVAGAVVQRDAAALVASSRSVALSTDPPYYDAVPYSDISDFFYVWLRRNVGEIWPDECATLLTPKSEEMVADSQRFGSAAAAQEHFESGIAEVMQRAAVVQRADTPAAIYYAYKATESKGATGWASFLQAVLDSGFQVTATWPVRTESPGRIRATGSNALASSIVLTCRPRKEAAALASRGEFIAALGRELPQAVRLLQSGNIAPVDLAQSTIGPGIKVFSRYARVVEADGSSMSVSAALAIINDVLGEILDGEEAELDRDSRFAATWYSQNGYSAGRSGDADGLARAKDTSLTGIEESGIGEARGGQFRLFERSELDPAWDPVDDDRRTVWEATQYLVAALDRSETEAGALMHRMGGYADRARQLAYVLFQKATEKGWAEEAGAYNGLITAWPSLQAMGGGDSDQGRLL